MTRGFNLQTAVQDDKVIQDFELESCKTAVNFSQATPSTDVSRIIIATGGTGGHIYPAIALAQRLSLENPGCKILFVGGGLDKNRYFDRDNFDYKTIACGAFVKKSPKAIFKAIYNICKGIWQSRKILSKFNPNVVIGFGSYFSFPPLVAAKLTSTPLILHEANSIPGKVNRLLSRWADVVGIHFPETEQLLKGKTIEVGLPLRQGFQRNTVSSQLAKKHYGLDENKSTLLVFGGSQGAQTINKIVCDSLCLNHSFFQVLHITGDPLTAEELKQKYNNSCLHACVKPFEQNMQLAWQAADAVICRSGAGTIAEQLEFEIPGILIPYPFAADNHQEHNADFMVAKVGGAVKLHEKNLTVERISLCLNEFLKDNGAVLAAMRQSMSAYKKKARTKDLYSLVFEYL